VIQSTGVPEDLEVFSFGGPGTMNIIEFMVGSGLTNSKSQARRLISQGGVDEVHLENGRPINRFTIKSFEATIKPHRKSRTIIQVGKRKAREIKQ
jgi:tyrosyl-tRNA synthetase